VGIEKRDTKDDIDYLAKKLVNLKLWSDEKGKPWRSSVKYVCFSHFFFLSLSLKHISTDNKILESCWCLNSRFMLY
jgi:hypothetical protein